MKIFRSLFFWLYALSVFITVLPFLCMLFGAAIAYAFDLQINESEVPEQIFLGIDWGQVAYFLLMMGWLAIATIQLGPLLILFIAIIHLFSALLKNKNSINPN